VTRILLVDDHAVVRAGLRAMLGAEPDLEVVGEAADGLTALERVEALAPDLMLLDLMLPGLSGLEVARRVASAWPAVGIVVLTFHAGEDYAAEILAQGAQGLVPKDADPAEILRAVRQVASGQRHFPPRLAAQRGSDQAADPWSWLTDREREIVQLVAEGSSHADIGERLGISPRTVEVHRGNAMRKLRLQGPLELVRFLVRRGILSLEG
jgi:two-component system response regulator NreC